MQEKIREEEFYYPVHLVKGKHINHLTNQPDPILRSYRITNDQTRIKDLTNNYIQEELNEKGLNFSTSYFINGSKSDPIQSFARKTIINHSYADGNQNFLLGQNPEYKCDDDISIINKEDPKEELNYLARARVAKRRKKAVELEKNNWKDLKRELYNLFFDMKKTVQNITSEAPQDFRDMSEEARNKIIENMRQFLIPRYGKKIKENFMSDSIRNKNMRKYMEVRSNELKDIVYSEALFQEKMRENEGDEVLERLTERLHDERIQELRRQGGDKARRFIRLLMVKELMMKQERDRVIEKRLEAQLEKNKDDLELEALLKRMKGIKPKEPISKVIKVPKPRQPEKSEISIVSRKPVPTFSEVESRKKDRIKKEKKKKKRLSSRLKRFDLRPEFVIQHMENLDFDDEIETLAEYKRMKRQRSNESRNEYKGAKKYQRSSRFQRKQSSKE